MDNAQVGLSSIILWVGITLTLIMLIKTALRTFVVPALVGFILLGFAIRFADTQWHMLPEHGEWLFKVLAEFGIFSLLFRIGLESNFKGLLKQLKTGSVIWISGVLVSGLLTLAATYLLLHIDIIPSLFIASAITATSVGVPAGVWKSAQAMKSKNGELLLDVAEMNDISGVMLMVLLFAIAPTLHSGAESGLFSVILNQLGIIFLKFVIFATICALFSLYVEDHITRFFDKRFEKPNPMLAMVGIGFIIAAAAGLLGFSVAIGAFFAGLAFSRDPNKVKMDQTFRTLYELFSPFFFVGIGLHILPQSISSALGLGLVLFVVAVFSKLVGNGAPAYFQGGSKRFWLIGVSLVPLAEITMIIMERGKSFGEWAVTPRIFTAMVFVSLATCIAAPIVIELLLRKWPQNGGE